jgi:hypothetical protein
MSVPEEQKAVKPKAPVKATSDLPEQKTKNEHQNAPKYVEQSMNKTPRGGLPPQKQAK